MSAPKSALIMAAQCCAAILFAASGCATFDSAADARAGLQALAHEHGFVRMPLSAGGFEFFALKRQLSSVSLTIYIEGDGAPWATPYHPPRDPTPREPVAWALANADQGRSVAWLARPCQYLDRTGLSRCNPAYWMERRFAPEVVAAYDEAVTRLKALSGVQHITLAGYSGGGVIAVLVAMRRTDVQGVITVAAPLSLDEWVSVHNLSPLAGSLNPVRQPPVRRADDTHFAGSRDNIVPPGIIERFVRSHGGRLETIADFDHNCCWARDWPQLLTRAGHGRRAIK